MIDILMELFKNIITQLYKSPHTSKSHKKHCSLVAFYVERNHT